MVKECIYLVIQIYFYANITLPFMIWEFEIFVDPTHKVKYKGKQNYEKIQNSI